MKGLLHSKTFRENLYKWLILYVGIMLLLTTVITYSRYISRFQGENDRAETARFNIAIKELECKDSKTGSCAQDSYWFTNEVEYYFSVDTTDVEISAKEMLTIKLHSNFDIVGIYALDLERDGVMQDGKIVDLESLKKTETPLNTDQTTQEGSIVLSLKDEFNAKNGKVKGYHVVVKEKPDVKNDSDFYNYNDILKINYLAEQKD